MKIHYKGKYNGDANSLPQREHPANAVAFKEPQGMATLLLVSSIVSIALLFLLMIPFVLWGRDYLLGGFKPIIPILLSVVIMLPHEFLHASCFKEDVYVYTNFKNGMLFVVGPEDFGKGRFIFMSMLPTIVFGIIPFVIFAINSRLVNVGFFGIMNIVSGSGDFVNVFNALVQVPRGAKIYLSGIRTYWYIPQK